MHAVEIHTPISTYAFMKYQSVESAQRAYDERHIAQEVNGDLKHRPMTTEDRILFERGLMGYRA